MTAESRRYFAEDFASVGEHESLLHPTQRKRFQQQWQTGSRRSVAIEDRINYVRRQQREPQQCPEITSLNPFRLSHLANRGVAPLIQELLVPERPRPRLHQRRISTRGCS